jgi:hypothetical protein
MKPKLAAVFLLFACYILMAAQNSSFPDYLSSLKKTKNWPGA